jgi:hypothetical protein
MTQPTPCETCGGTRKVIQMLSDPALFNQHTSAPCPDCAAPQAEATESIDELVGDFRGMMADHRECMAGPAAREVVRYSLYERDTNGDFDAHMEASPDGKWIEFSDHTRLLAAEREKHAREYDEAVDQFKHTQADNEVLQRERDQMCELAEQRYHALKAAEQRVDGAREIMVRACSWFQIQEVAHPKLGAKAKAIWQSMQAWLAPAKGDV